MCLVLGIVAVLVACFSVLAAAIMVNNVLFYFVLAFISAHAFDRIKKEAHGIMEELDKIEEEKE